MEKIYITVNELIDMLGISRSKAYNLIKEMNSELKREGYIVIKGKVPRAYFEKRWYTPASADTGIRAGADSLRPLQMPG